MEMVEHIVTIQSQASAGERPTAGLVSEILRLVEDAVRQAVGMAFRYTSGMPGRPPAWLAQAGEVLFVGISNSAAGEVTLRFQVPRFRDAAQEVYAQGLLFKDLRPKETDTSFDVLGEVFADIRNQNRDSLRFDDRMLTRLYSFKKKAEKRHITGLLISGDRWQKGHSAIWDSTLCDFAESLHRSTPHAKRARVCGKVDMVRNSDSSFELLLEDGSVVPGILSGSSQIDLGGFFKQDVMAEGQAFFRASGRMLRLELEGIRKATKADAYFSQIPKSDQMSAPPSTWIKPQTSVTGANAVFDRWPGDESDEEFMEAVRNLS